MLLSLTGLGPFAILRAGREGWWFTFVRGSLPMAHDELHRGKKRFRTLADAGLTFSALLFISVYTYLSDSLLVRRMAENANSAGPNRTTLAADIRLAALPQPEQGVPIFALHPTSAGVDSNAQAASNDLERRIAAIERESGEFVRGRMSDGTVHIFLHDAARMLAADLRWDPRTRVGALITDQALVRIRADSSTATVNDEPRELPCPVRVLEGKPFVPIRTLAALQAVSLRGDPQTGLMHVKAEGGEFTIAVPERAFRIEISRSGRWLKVFYAGELAKEYPICVGAGNNTPVGHFHIESKAVWPSWRAYWGELIPGGSRRNPLGARWLGTTARGRVTGWPIGIHGTNQPSSIGQRISGGCIRTYNHHAIELYETIPIGTAVWIHE